MVHFSCHVLCTPKSMCIIWSNFSGVNFFVCLRFMFYYSSLLFVLRMIYWIEVGLDSTVEKASMDSSNHTTVIAFGNSNTATTFALDISKQVFYYFTRTGVYYGTHRLVSSNVNGSLRRVVSTNYYYYSYDAITTMVYSNEKVYYITRYHRLYVFDLESESSQRLYSLLDTYQSHGMVLLSHEHQEQGTRQELHMFLSSI